MHDSSTHHSMKDSDEAVDVDLVVVDVRADAQAAEPRSDVDVLGRQALEQPLRHAARKAQAENMRRAPARGGNGPAAIGSPGAEPVGEHAQAANDRRGAP